MAKSFQTQFIATTIAILLLASDVTGSKCHGRPGLIQEYTHMCTTNSGAASLSESQSCLTGEIANRNLTCSPSLGCGEINIRVAPGQYANTNGLIWSAAVCYEQTMTIGICMPGAAVVTTTTVAATGSTTTAPTTTTPAGPTVSGQAEDTGTTTEGTTTTTATTTTATTTTATTTTATTTTGPTTTTTTATTTTGTTTTTEALPNLAGCLSGSVTFTSPTCNAGQSNTATAAIFTDGNLQGSSTGSVNLELQVVGCCAEDKCRVDDTVDRPNTCLYGDENSVAVIKCKDECFGYLMITGDTLTAQFGCLADIDLTGSGFTHVTDCSGDHAAGKCNDANNDAECLKCCTASSCNNWATKNDLLGISGGGGDTGKSDGTNLTSTGILLVAAMLAVRLY